MKWTPQKAITSASAAAAWRERPSESPSVVGDVLDLGQLVVVGEDDGVALGGERPHLVAAIASTSSGERSGAIVGWIVGSSCMEPSSFPMFAGPAGIAASNQSNELNRVYLSPHSGDPPRLSPCLSSPRSRSPSRRLDAALAGATVESALAPGMNVMKTFDPPLEALAGRELTGGAADRQDAGGRVRRPGAADPPDVGRAAALASTSGPRQRPRLAGAGPARGRPRAAPARVRDEAAGLGEAAAERRRRRGRGGRPARPGSLAGAAARRVRRGDRPAPPPAPAAPPPGRHRRHRPLLGRRDPLGGAPLALQEGLRPRRRGGRAAARGALHVLGDAIDHYEETIRRASSCPTKRRSRCASTSTRASPARAAARRSRPSSSPSTR